MSACRESSIVWLLLPGFSEVFDCFHLCRLDHLFFSDLLLKLTFWELELPRVVSSKQAFLWDFTKAANGGKHYRTFFQKTGSCVGNGGGQAVWYLSAMEVIRLGDREQVLLPFYFALKGL